MISHLGIFMLFTPNEGLVVPFPPEKERSLGLAPHRRSF
jgi:hypothetical protein